MKFVRLALAFAIMTSSVSHAGFFDGLKEELLGKMKGQESEELGKENGQAGSKEKDAKDSILPSGRIPPRPLKLTEFEYRQNPLSERFRSANRFTSYRANNSISQTLKSMRDNLNSLIEEGDYIYYFSSGKSDSEIYSAQAEKSAFGNVKNYLASTAGLLEPVMFVNPDLSIAVDKRATQFIHGRLSKNLKLLPLSETYRFGDLIIKQIQLDADEAYRTSVSGTDRSNGRGNLLSMITAAAGGFNDLATDLSSIYNSKLSKSLSENGFKGAGYFILVNSSNEFTPVSANYLMQKSWFDYLIKNIAPKEGGSDTGRLDFMMGHYWPYLAMYQNTISAMRSGSDASGISLDFVSSERLLGRTSGRYQADFFVKSSDIQLAYTMAALESNSIDTGKAQVECRDFPERIGTKKCWEPMLRQSRSFWSSAAADSSVRADIQSSRDAYFKRLGGLLDFVAAIQKPFELSGARKSQPLK